MAKKNFITTTAVLLSQADGRKLAVDMLVGLRDSNADEASIESRYRPGKAQCDILSRYQRVMRDQGNPAVEVGFNAVPNDFLGHVFYGIVEPEFYEAIDDDEIEREFTAEERGD